MPSLVPSRRSRSPAGGGEGTDAVVPTLDPSRAASRTPANKPRSRTSKLTITSKRSAASKAGMESAIERTGGAEDSKRRKLTPNLDDEDEGDEDNGNTVQSQPVGMKGKPGDDRVTRTQNSVDNEGDAEQDEGNHDYEDREVVIPVAEDYDSDESESGMADSFDKMRTTVEEVPHAPGAIVRVQLENFVTYTKVTFEPGPSLNMVIGPNGTGKSTLVCAICLGLGFGPENLGRAKDVAEFVKNGSDHAIIEIELKGFPTDEINPTIKRRISRDGLSQYWIDGRKQTHKSVSQLTKLMNIQIDNLCQFLPQDRVVEFAGLGPVPLLRETQRAAAPPEVLKDHETLKTLRSQEVSWETELDSCRQSLSTMEGRQQLLEREVARLRERQILQENIKLLEDAIPFVNYTTSRTHRDRYKKEYQSYRKELADIKKEQEPQQKQIDDAETLRSILEQWTQEEKASLAALETDLRKEMENGIGSLKLKEAKAASDLKGLLDTERERKQNISDTKRAIARFEGKLENDPGPLDLSQFNEKIEDVNRQIRHLKTGLAANEDEISPLANQEDDKNAQLVEIKQWISNMNNAVGQRVEQLRRQFPESHQVYMWLQKNKERFKGPVYGPPIVECNIKDVGYQGEIESLFGPGDKLAFTCTNKEDFNELMTCVYGNNKDRRGLGVSEVTIKYIEKGLDEFPPIATVDQVKSWGFDGLALDFIDGPPEVLSMLCNSISLHRIGVSKRNLTIGQQQALKTGGKMGRWVAGSVLTTIRRRAEYGAETEMNSVVRGAQHFKITPIDVQKRDQNKRREMELEEDIKQIRDKINDLKSNETDMRKQLNSLSEKKKKVMEAKETQRSRAGEFIKIKARLQMEREKLAGLEEGGKGFKANVAESETRLIQINMDRVKATTAYAEQMRKFVFRYENLVTAELHLIEASSNLQYHKNWNQSFKERIEEKQKHCEDAKTKYDKVVEASKQLRERCHAIMGELSDEQKQAVQTHSAKSEDELKVEIRQKEVQLENMHEGNPDAIRQHGIRQRQIEELSSKMAEKGRALDTLRENIKKIRGRWEPRIDQLVNNISEAFSRSFEFIHCAGAVRVRKEGKDGSDFESWAIEIMVKFRETENMQVLTAQRQSGGERAVSTVFYLMALQSLARAPFRVVDEINQGMDPRNERLVHKRMVKIACKKHTSQYFLITPKLLVDLDYHERMKVLCINSGDWVTKDHVQDFSRYIAAGRRMMAAG